jgi:hypothetical protein
MNSIQACEEVLKNGVSLLRRRNENLTDEYGKPVPQYDVKPSFTGKKKGWFYLDAFTASTIMACYNALNDENKAKAPRIPITRWAEFAFKHIK